MATLIESNYTCAETILLRISQYFENSLSDQRRHKDLLEKMTLDEVVRRTTRAHELLERDLSAFVLFLKRPLYNG